MRIQTTCEERSLAGRLARRRSVEQHFAEIGHTFRHGLVGRKIENFLIRPLLKGGLRLAGLYKRGTENAISPVIRRVSLEFPALPPAFDGFQILQISDLHIDGTDGLAEALVPLLSDLRPDLCVLTGDYRYEDRGSCEAVYPLMRSIVSSISATHGIFGILGNHDSAEIAFELEETGVRMLINESAEITRGADSIWLVGVDDPFDYQCDDLDGALRNVPPQALKILLAHAPELYNEAAESGVDLYLCGHTHAGQIRLPLIGSLRHNAMCPKALSYGAWTYKQMQGYTTSGAGCALVPVRFNCPPEVVMIELRAKAPY